jgi:hypothetical protein
MDPVLSTILIVAAMALVVVGFRALVRRPSGVGQEDAPGVRTVATFEGEAAEFFAEDPADGPLVGVGLFRGLCEGLAAGGVEIIGRGPVQNAQGAQCLVQSQRFRLVLEKLEECWVLCVEWAPQTAAEKRHLRLTREVFTPPDSPELRRLLAAVDRWLKGRPGIAAVRWHRKERWLGDDLSQGVAGPVDG